MDFESVFRLILEKFYQENITFALIGGFALFHAGYSRATNDIDFLVAKEDAEKIKQIMVSYSYNVLFENEELVNYIGKMQDLGRVDFLYAQRKYSREMLKRAEEKEIFEGKFKIKVVRPDDIVGLKLQSALNDPERYSKDISDIEELIRINYKTMDMKLVEEYFGLFEKKDELNSILKRLNYVK